VEARDLLREVWGFPEDAGSPELVRAHVHNLRAKLRRVTGGEPVLQTLPAAATACPEAGVEGLCPRPYT